MLTEPTIDKLRKLRLEAMATSYREQQQTPDRSELSFDERFGLLVDAEYLARENKRLATRLREAKLKLSQACVEDIDYPAKRELDKAIVRQLAGCRWIFHIRDRKRSRRRSDYPRPRPNPGSYCSRPHRGTPGIEDLHSSLQRTGCPAAWRGLQGHR